MDELWIAHSTSIITGIIALIVGWITSFLTFRRNQKKAYLEKEREYVDVFIKIMSEKREKRFNSLKDLIDSIPDNDEKFSFNGAPLEFVFEKTAEEYALFMKSKKCSELVNKLDKLYYSSHIEEESELNITIGITNNSAKEELVRWQGVMIKYEDERSELMRKFCSKLF